MKKITLKGDFTKKANIITRLLAHPTQHAILPRSMRSNEDGSGIRAQAERIAREHGSPGPSPQDKLIYDLRVHQIELEMQYAELQETQQELLQSRRKYELLFHHAPVPYFVFDAHGGVVSANLAAAKLVEADRKRLFLKPFIVFLPLEYHTDFFTHLRRVMELGRHESTELQIYTRNDSHLWVRLESHLQQDGDGTAQCFTTMLDVTDRKHIEDDLILAREEAIRTSEAQYTLLSSINNGLRIPIEGIVSLGETVRDRIQSEEIASLHDANRALAKVLSDVCDARFAANSRFRYQKEVFDPREFISVVKALFRPLSLTREVEISVEVDQSVSPSLVGEINGIRQVVVAIVGTLLRRMGRTTLRLRLSETEVAGFVRELTIEAIETHSHETPRGERTAFAPPAIDLATSKKVALQLGGQIYESTAPHENVHVYFAIPLELPSLSETGGHHEKKQAVHAETNVLVAEGNVINQLLMRRILEKASYRVDTAGSQSAIEVLLNERRYDLIFLDMSSPQIAGAAVTRAIRSGANDNEVPIVALSDHLRATEIKAYTEQGVTDVIGKPISRDTILSKAHAYARRNRL